MQSVPFDDVLILVLFDLLANPLIISSDLQISSGQRKTKNSKNL